MVSSSDESSTAPSYSSVCHTCKKPHNFTKNICIEHLHIWTLHSNICTYFSILKFSLPNICIVPKHSRSRNYHKHISQKYWPTYWPSLLTIFGIFWCIFFLFTILLLSILHTIFHFQFCSFLLKVYFVLKLLYRSIDM